MAERGGAVRPRDWAEPGDRGYRVHPGPRQWAPVQRGGALGDGLLLPAAEGDSGELARDPEVTPSRRLGHIPIEGVEHLFVAQACCGALGHTCEWPLRKPYRERERILEQFVESAEQRATAEGPHAFLEDVVDGLRRQV